MEDGTNSVNGASSTWMTRMEVKGRIGYLDDRVKR